MHIYKKTTYSFLFIMILIFMMPGTALSDQAKGLQSEIEARQKQLTRHQKAVEKLSRQEREAYSRLAKAEDKVDEISLTLESMENELADMISREAEVAAQYEKLSREKTSTQNELAGLLKNIWPIFLESQGKGLAEIMQWSDLDREMTWLRAIYSQAEKTYSLLQSQSENLSANLIKLRIMKDEFQSAQNQVNKTKDQLLNEKLGFLKELQEIRAQRLADEEMISEIINVIDSLNYQLQADDDRDFESQKGHLIWPAAGRLVSSYSPSDEPPHNGLSIALEENSPVRAISWGKVMHNGTLRGFGRVVILFHGDDYYTLYAYLAESSLQIGQEVEKGESIGRAGYYPQVNSHGIYFELRFKQKAVNPIPWLEKI